jgi:hypothetical protein
VAWKGKDGQRFWKVLKQKDGEELGAIGFQLLVMATGRHRRRGQIETSCIVVPAEQGAQPAQLDTDALLRQKEGEDIDRLVAAIRREGSFGSRDGLVMAAGINLQRGRAMLDLALQRGAIVDLGKPKRPKLVLPGTARTQQDQGGRESPHTPRDGRTDSVPSRPSRPRPPETDRTDWTDSPTGGGQ